MRHPRDRDLVLQVGVVREEMPAVHAELAEHRLELPVELLLRLLVRVGVAEPDRAVVGEGYPVLRPGQVLGREPEVDGVGGDPSRASTPAPSLVSPASRPGTSAPATCPPSGCCPADSRTPRPRSRSRSARGSSGRRLDSAPSTAPGPPGCCGTCSCDRPGPSRWRGRSGACRSPRRAAAWPSWPPRRRRRRCPPSRSPARPSRSTTTSVTVSPPASVSRVTASAFVSRVTFECSSAGRTAITSASDFACTRQGKPSQSLQRTQRLYGMFPSSSMTPQGAWKGR